MGRTVKFEFDPFEKSEVELSASDKKAALEEISFLVHAEILRNVSEGNSPVAGYGRFPRLNKEYAKSQKGGNTLPNLELTGDMLSSLKVSPSNGKIYVRITGKQGDKADGHCNHSGESSLPLRRFIPSEDDSDSFKRDINNAIDEIIASYETKNQNR